jgi:glycosyltransferase involved in cell wall biosynthesis
VNPFPLVTVTIPTYNCAEYLPDTLDSVLRQSYPQVEIVVVDDGSTDNTPRILAGYGDRLTVVSQPHQGLGAARNAGVRRATGDFVAFLDADDIWEPDKLELQMQLFLAHPSTDVTYTNFVPFGEPAEYQHGFEGFRGALHDLPRRRVSAEGYVFETPAFFAHFLRHSTNPCWTSTVVARRSALAQVGPFSEDHAECDAEMWLRLARHCRFGYVDRILVRRRVRRERFRRDPIGHERRIQAGTIRMLERLPTYVTLTAAEHRILRAKLAEHQFAAGYLEFSHESPTAARRHFARSFRCAPSRRAALYLLAACLPPGLVDRLRAVKHHLGQRGTALLRRREWVR